MLTKNTRQTPPKTKTRQGGSSLLTLFAGIVVLGLVIAAVIVAVGKDMGVFGTKPATVTGEIVFTALQPDPGDKGSIKIYVRDKGSSADFQDTGLDIPLTANQTWEWPGAKYGKNYELQAGLVIDGQVVKKSDVESVTAPATNIDLALKINWKDLPSDVLSATDLSIDGTVSINGYIPMNSQLQVLAVDNTTADGEAVVIGDDLQANEKVIQSIANPTNSNVWSWNAAQPLKSYVIRAILKDNTGKQVGESQQIVNIEAADQQVGLIINSAAQPAQTQVQPPAVVAQVPTPQPTPVAVNVATSPLPTVAAKPSPAPAPAANITGTVYLNGPKNENTSLLMLWKKVGDASYNVVNRYPNPNQSGTSWMFDGAQTGQQYELQAALQVNGQNTSTAPQPQIVTAPASNVNFTLNTNFLVPAPNTQPIFQVCINTDQAVIVIPQVPNAAQYWVQVGTSAGDNSLADTKMKVDTSHGDQKITVGVPKGKQSFVRYAYAECANCSNDNNFSPWTQTTGFTCE